MKPMTYVGALIVLIVAITALLVYPRLFPGAPEPPSPLRSETSGSADLVNKAVGYYTCPMHPAVRSDRPGACPVCGMSLVRRSSGASQAVEISAAATPVTLSPSQQVMANVGVIATRRARLRREISAVGTIAYAEPNFSHIAMRFPGRIERLHLTFTGQRVAKGDPVADVYSPDVISAQREFLLSLESVDRTKDAHRDIAEGALTLLAQSKQKLLRWGLTEDQLSQLGATREVMDTLTIYSPASGTILKKYAEAQQYLASGANLYDIADLTTIWMIAEVYEVDLPLIRVGVSAEAKADAYPEERFSGRVSFIDPVIDPATRTTRARIALSNRNELLKVGMFLQVTMLVDLPLSIVVPVTSLLSTGSQTVVWVDKGGGLFEPRTVTAGVRAGDQVQILKGLELGESVVVSGGYLLDSESQLQATSVGAPPPAHPEGH